jgi:hypothetical protein
VFFLTTHRCTSSVPHATKPQVPIRCNRFCQCASCCACTGTSLPSASCSVEEGL